MEHHEIYYQNTLLEVIAARIVMHHIQKDPQHNLFMAVNDLHPVDLMITSEKQLPPPPDPDSIVWIINLFPEQEPFPFTAPKRNCFHHNANLRSHITPYQVFDRCYPGIPIPRAIQMLDDLFTLDRKVVPKQNFYLFYGLASTIFTPHSDSLSPLLFGNRSSQDSVVNALIERGAPITVFLTTLNNPEVYPVAIIHDKTDEVLVIAYDAIVSPNQIPVQIKLDQITTKPTTDKPNPIPTARKNHGNKKVHRRNKAKTTTKSGSERPETAPDETAA